MSKIRAKLPLLGLGLKTLNMAATTAADEREMDDDRGKKPQVIELEPCPICHVPVGTETPEEIVEAWATLPCGHRFGSFCVKNWLGMAEQPACPMCRQPMLHICGHPFLPTLEAPPLGDDVDDHDNDEEDELGHKNGGRFQRRRSSRLIAKQAVLSVVRVTSSRGGSKSPNNSRHNHRHRRRGSRAKSPTPPSPSSSTSSVSSAASSASSSSSSSEASLPSLPSLPGSPVVATSSSSSSSSSSPASPILLPDKPTLDTACSYCFLFLAKDETQDGGGPSSPTIMGRAAGLALRMFAPSRAAAAHVSAEEANAKAAYWERWRRAHGPAFGGWWAEQAPRTEPARELPFQGWAHY